MSKKFQVFAFDVIGNFHPGLVFDNAQEAKNLVAELNSISQKSKVQLTYQYYQVDIKVNNFGVNSDWDNLIKIKYLTKKPFYQMFLVDYKNKKVTACWPIDPEYFSDVSFKYDTINARLGCYTPKLELYEVILSCPLGKAFTFEDWEVEKEKYLR